MKRFHVHVSVPDLSTSIRFYSAMFGMPPSVQKDDYAKWMIEDPRVNFAISARGAATGVNHLGLQVDTAEELGELRQRFENAEISVLEESGAACCYARSDKYWVTDPQGIAWETFHTLGEIPVFGQPAAVVAEAPGAAVCCAPQVKPKVRLGEIPVAQPRPCCG